MAMLHSGQYVNIWHDISTTFTFHPPKDRWKADVWKGWYRQALAVCKDVPKVWEFTGNHERYVIHQDPEVSAMFITYRFYHRSDRNDMGTLILCRKA